MKTGEKIRMLRKQAGLTQTELGEKLGVKTNAVSKWECGRVEEIPMSKIKTMSTLFDVPPSYLIDDDAETNKNKPAEQELDELDKELIRRLTTLSPGELEKVDAFVQGLLASR